MSLSLLKHAWRAVARSNQLSLASAHSRTLTSSIPSVTNTTKASRTSPAADELTTRLRAARGAGAVLGVVQAAPAASARHMLLALQRLFQLLRAGKSERERQELIKNPDFGVFCQNFEKRAHDLEVDEAVEAIKFLTNLKVPVDSLVVRTVLQLIHLNIRNLRVQQIMFLDLILSQQNTKSPLLDTLKLELPLAFQDWFPQNINTASVPVLRDVLHYCCARGLPDRDRDRDWDRDIDCAVSRLLQRHRDIDTRSANSIISALCNVDSRERFFPTRYELLRVCFDILSRALPRMSHEDVVAAAASVRRRIVEEPSYYHARLLDALADYVLHNELGFEEAVAIARTPLSLGHPHRRLVEYLCSLVARTPRALADAGAYNLLDFITCLASSNHAPPEHQWAEIRRQISSNPILDDKHAALPWLKMCAELASLGHYEDRLLGRAFSREFLDRYLSRRDCSALKLLALHQAVRMFHSEEYQLPEDILQKTRARYPRSGLTEQMQRRLAGVLGTAGAVARDVLLPGGIVADLLMCLQGGHPISLLFTDGHREVPVEDLNLPDGSLTVCMITFHGECFSRASDELRGGFRLVPTVLERQGLAVVPVNSLAWLREGKRERGPWLLRQVARRAGVKLVSSPPDPHHSILDPSQ